MAIITLMPKIGYLINENSIPAQMITIPAVIIAALMFLLIGLVLNRLTPVYSHHKMHFLRSSSLEDRSKLVETE